MVPLFYLVSMKRPPAAAVLTKLCDLAHQIPRGLRTNASIRDRLPLGLVLVSIRRGDCVATHTVAARSEGVRVYPGKLGAQHEDLGGVRAKYTIQRVLQLVEYGSGPHRQQPRAHYGRDRAVGRMMYAFQQFFDRPRAFLVRQASELTDDFAARRVA